MVMQFNQCCCGCTLRTGTIIIGVLGLLGGISMVIQGISGSVGHGNDKSHENLVPTINPAYGSGNATGPAVITGESGFRVSQAIMGFIEIIICALLLVGTMKNSPKLIYPWIILSWIMVVLTIILFLGLGILYFVAGAVAVGLITMIIGAIVVAINVYFILVVNSFHISLKSGPVSRA